MSLEAINKKIIKTKKALAEAVADKIEAVHVSKKDPYRRYDDRKQLLELLDAFLEEKEFDSKRADVQFHLYNDGSMIIFDTSGVPALLRDSATGKFYQQRADRLSTYLLKPYRELKKQKFDNWRNFETEVSEDFLLKWMAEKEMALAFISEIEQEQT